MPSPAESLLSQRAQRRPVPTVQIDPLELASTVEARELSGSQTGPVEVPLLQRAAQELFGVEPQPLEEVQPPPFVRPERPAALRDAEQMIRDLRESAKYAAGITTMPERNVPAKIEALRRETTAGQKPLSERSYLELAASVPRNAIRELEEFPVGIGLLIGQGMRKAGGALMSVSGWPLEVELPNPETGEIEKLRLPYGRVSDLPPDIRDKLIELGASFGSEPLQSSWWDTFLAEESKRMGFVEAAEIPEDATSFGVPLTEKRWSPRRFVEETAERPISRLIDFFLAARTPVLAVRGGAAGAHAAARTAARLGSEATDRVLTRAGIKATEFADRAEAVTSVAAARDLARRGASLTEGGRQFLANHDARKLTNLLLRESRESSAAWRRNAQIEIHRALSKLSDDELRFVPAIVEGRARMLPSELTPQMKTALDVTKANIRKLQGELIDFEMLGAETAENRAFAPLVVTTTGKRIAPKGWDRARVVRENEKVAKINQHLPETERYPDYLLPDEYEHALDAVRSDWNGVRAQIASLPDVEDLAPTYFPRYARQPSLREVLRRFFRPAVLKPGKQPFQKSFSGAALLREADPKDVERALLEHIARVRYLVDSTRVIDELRVAPFTQPLRLGDDLLPGHVAFNPDGALVFFRKQLDFSESTAKALEKMGDLESALAHAIRDVLPDGLKASLVGVSRRQTLYQIPRGAAKSLEQTFRPTSPWTRIFWDKPTDAWRAGVLALSPRWQVNNNIGGIVLGTLAGIPPQRLLKPISAAERAALPERLSSQTMVFSEGFAPRLSGPVTTAEGRIARAIADSKPLKLPVEATRRVVNASFAFNEAVDLHYRSRVYLEQSRRVARNALVKRSGSSLIRSRELMLQMAEQAKDPAMVRRIMESTDRVFFNFNRLTPWERRYVRRVITFWSWYREITRLTLSMPNTMPARAQALASLSRLAEQAQDSEIRQHLGIPKEFLPEYLRDQVFVGLDNDGQVTFLSPRGANVFHGSTLLPLAETQGRLHPLIQLIIEESTGGRTIGRWGNYVPFRFREMGSRFRIDAETGRLVERQPFAAAGKRVARTIPLTSFLEDLVQYVTEGRITTRFEDVTPLSNILPALTGGRIRRTAVVGKKPELEPRREKTLAQALGSFAGVTTSHYELSEVLESEVKSRSGDLGAIFNRKFLSDPEFRRLFDQVLRERQGERFEGLRSFFGEQEPTESARGD